MYKSFTLICLALLVSFFGASSVCFAFVLLTKEEALEQAFWPGAEIENETRELSGEVLERIKERLGGQLVYYQEGAEEQVVEERTSYTFYFASKGGERLGVAIIDTEPGKWGPVTFCTTLNIKGTVKSVRVMSYEEIRGRPIARRSFMNQYRGKNSNSTLTVGRDIIGISGATISSRSATFAVKKALVIYDELYLKK